MLGGLGGKKQEHGGRVANEELMMALENDILRLRGLKKKALLDSTREV
jgi:hypothetical protein